MAKRKFIDEIQISNFKFFPEISEKSQAISVKGKHFLLFGENGSGKSSIFWALYTLLECANKSDKSEIIKYFDLSNNQNLINIHANSLPAPNARFAENSFIKIKFLNDTNDSYQLAHNKTDINGNEEARQSNFASDFLNYRFLYNAFNFNHSSNVDLFEHFKYLVFPYVKIKSCSIWKVVNDWEVVNTENAREIMHFLDNGPKYFLTIDRKREYNISSKNVRELAKMISVSIKSLTDFVNDITIRANEILKNDLLYEDITFTLRLEVKKDFNLTVRTYTPPIISLILGISEYDGHINKVHKLQSFLNEAKLTAISLAIRLAVLEKRPSDSEVKILVLDDLMISLDMNNREKILNLIFKKYISEYQLFILTHDKVFFEYIKSFISQKSNVNDWQISELYSSKEETTNKSYPVLIENDFGNYEKALKYFKAKDYTTCSLYIRKEIEKLIFERLPIEFTETIDGQFHNLAHLWKLFKERYNLLSYSFVPDFDIFFQRTKLVLLNPQAHHSLNYPVYKVEIERAIEFIEILKDVPFIDSIILLSEGVKLKFTHPSKDYTFEFELTSDFRIDGLRGNTNTILPKCKVLIFQYEGNEFWDVDRNIKFSEEAIVSIKANSNTKLDKIKDRILSISTLGLTYDVFVENTISLNGLWSLKEILDKAGITI